MKRKLTDKEKELTKKGIKIRQRRLKEMKTELQYFNDFDDFNNKWKDYLEQKEKRIKKENEQIIVMRKKKLIEGVEFEEEALKKEKEQIKKGVEVKEMVGVS